MPAVEVWTQEFWQDGNATDEEREGLFEDSALHAQIQSHCEAEQSLPEVPR